MYKYARIKIKGNIIVYTFHERPWPYSDHAKKDLEINFETPYNRESFKVPV